MAAPRVSPRVAVGEVVGCHGLRGELKVRPLTDDPHRFGELERVFLGEEQRCLEIRSYRIHKGHVLLMVEGCDDRGAAEALRGHTLTIPREERRELPEDRWYLDDLVGLEVRDTEGRPVGRVSGFDEQSGGGLLEVRLDGGGRVDVPFATRWVPEVEVEQGFVTLGSGWHHLLPTGRR